MRPKISVLLPTRGRYDRLQKAIFTLDTAAHNDAQVEYLLRTDDDEPAALDIIDTNGALKAIFGDRLKEFRGPRLGYQNMHKYYTELAKEAKGDLLFVWNDDTEMLTNDWDELLLTLPDNLPRIQFIRRDSCTTADDTFPVIDRRIFEKVGRLGGHCYVDTWLSWVSRDAGNRLFRNDIVFHHHRLEDQTARDEKEVLTAEHHQLFGSLEPERQKDVAKIRELMVELGFSPAPTSAKEKGVSP